MMPRQVEILEKMFGFNTFSLRFPKFLNNYFLNGFGVYLRLPIYIVLSFVVVVVSDTIFILFF